MQVNLGVWDKLNRLLILLLFVAGPVGIFFWYLPLIQQNQALRQQILVLNGKIQTEQKEQRRLKEQIEAVQKDPRTVERLVRERLGYALSNETVIYFEPADRH